MGPRIREDDKIVSPLFPICFVIPPRALLSLASFCPRCEVFFKARGASPRMRESKSCHDAWVPAFAGTTRLLILSLRPSPEPFCPSHPFVQDARCSSRRGVLSAQAGIHLVHLVPPLSFPACPLSWGLFCSRPLQPFGTNWDIIVER